MAVKILCGKRQSFSKPATHFLRRCVAQFPKLVLQDSEFQTSKPAGITNPHDHMQRRRLNAGFQRTSPAIWRKDMTRSGRQRLEVRKVPLKEALVEIECISEGFVRHFRGLSEALWVRSPFE